MEAEIDKPFGDILVADAASILDVADIDDAFMRHPAVRAGIENRIMRCQPCRHVIGGKNGCPRGRLQTLASHHADISIGDRQDAGGPERGGTDRTFASQWRAWQKRHQMRRDANRPNARATTAMWDAEGLVKVQMADICTEFRQRAMSDKGVQIGPVDIDLTAGLMDDLAQLDDRFLEHTMRRGVGDHDGRQRIAMRFGLCFQILKVDIAVIIAFDNHDLHAGHCRRGRVGAMRRLRDQADIATAFAARVMIARDRQQPGKLAL